jgi:hypothetical protein
MVQAQILYKDRAGNEIEDVPRGYWLAPFADYADLLLNDTRGLIVMVMSHDGRLPGSIPNVL